MKKMKAVILEISGSQCVVLADDGSFRSLPNAYGAQVGEEIELEAEADIFTVRKALNTRQSRQPWQVWSAAAALLLLTLTVALGWNFAQASTTVAMVSLDINPSVELAVNAREQVVKATAVNADGEKVLQALELKNQPVPAAMSIILEQARNMGYLTDEHSWVLVGLAPSGDKELPPALEEAVKSGGAALQEKVNARVAVLQLNEQERAKAEQAGVSIGEYALWQSADKAGIKVEAKELKIKNERVRLLEAPEIQAQVLKDKGVLKIPGAEGGNSAIGDMLERDKVKEKDLIKDKDKMKLKPGQEDQNSKTDDDERGRNGDREGTSSNSAATPPGKSGIPDSPLTGPLSNVPVFSPNSPAARPQANESERAKEYAADGNEKREPGNSSDDELERKRSGKE